MGDTVLLRYNAKPTNRDNDRPTCESSLSSFNHLLKSSTLNEYHLLHSPFQKKSISPEDFRNNNECSEYISTQG